MMGRVKEREPVCKKRRVDPSLKRPREDEKKGEKDEKDMKERKIEKIERKEVKQKYPSDTELGYCSYIG